MFTSLTRWPVQAIENRPRLSTLMDEVNGMLSGPRYIEPAVMEPIQPTLVQCSNLMACGSATHLPNQFALLRGLLQTGSRVHERDANGDTCAHIIILRAQPDQPWVVQSLTTLLQAGADLRHRNNAGFTVYDLACDGPPELGTFNKDVLLQALIDSRSSISDDRVLAPRRLTQFYTDAHYDMVCGKYSAQQATLFSRAMSNRLKDYVQYHRLPVGESIQSTCLKRVIGTDTTKWTADPDTVFREILQYLQRVTHGKAHVEAMRRERLSTEVWKNFQGLNNASHMIDSSITASLLEFDWFKPVDPEDVYLTHVDNLIEHLEALETTQVSRQHIYGVIEALQSSIPSYRAVSVRTTDSTTESSADSARPATSCSTISSFSSPQTSTSPALSLGIDQERPSSAQDIDIMRKESIAKTPAEYYAPDSLRFRSTTLPVKLLKSIDSQSLSDMDGEDGRRQKWRWGTRRKKT